MAGDDKSMQDLFAALRASSAGVSQQSQPVGGHGPLAPSHADYTSRSSATPPSTHVHSNSKQHQHPGASPPSSSPDPTPVDRTASLLNLLRYNQTAQQSVPSQSHSSSSGSIARPGFPGPAVPVSGRGSSATQNIHGRGVSASDLVASFMGKMSGTVNQPEDSPPPVASPAPSGNPQDYLLQLLNRTQLGANTPPAQFASPPTTAAGTRPSNGREEEAKVAKQPAPQDSPARMLSSGGSREPTPAGKSHMANPTTKPEAAKNPIFTYVNPFEQLAASSPRNAGSRSGTSTPQKETPPISRLTSGIGKSEEKREGVNHRSGLGQEVQAKQEDGISERKREEPATQDSLTVAAPTTDPATVAQALNDVSEKVSRQADFALAKAEEEKQESPVKAELKKEDENVTPRPSRKASEQIKSQPDVVKKESDGDGHASADDEESSAHGEQDSSVPVYNFVMKPFVAINITQRELPTLQFREDTITDIARLKKEFDQIDRTLTTASTEYILYSLPRSGGIRVIRQEDGVDRQIFKETKDHVFNVALSSAPHGKSSYDLQTSIATATSGTVYWTALHHNGDMLESADIKQHCLTFPPVPTNDEHAPGGQLKTRAKRSSRHPELFAIGRGKLIQIIFPLHAAASKQVNENRVVDTEAYYKLRSLRINTGKAGKDFTFSEDDTVIATLDKAGRLRFWDVRELVHESNSDATVLPPIEIRTPILTLHTALPNEKSWPTSVLLVDKLRAYAKGTALRYVIVGMKQNHTLQLWDLGIGKAIQELYFPHSKESDAICSICYHASSGIIVVGHPTRNSIYFIHLSAPKYNLPGMSQARYLTRLADKDPSLPKLEATAIMSGMREYSFASKGQLRSVDLLPVNNDTLAVKDQPGLFELYVMHSKGVTMLSIHREDLGWSEDMKVLTPVNAEKEGIIRIKELVQPPVIVVSENSSVNGDVAPSTVTSKKHSTTLAKIADKGTADESERGEVKDRGANGAAGTSEKTEKRKKKKASSKNDEAVVPPPAPHVPSSTSTASKGLQSLQGASHHNKEAGRPSTNKKPAESVDPKHQQHGDTDPITFDVSTDFIDKELNKIEMNITRELERVFGEELDKLHAKMIEYQKVRDAQHGADREALLRLVSKHLGTNLEAALNKIMTVCVDNQLIPATEEAIQVIVAKELGRAFGENSDSALSLGIVDAISKATDKAFQDRAQGWKQSLDASNGALLNEVRKHLKETEIRVNDLLRSHVLQRSDNMVNNEELHKAVISLREELSSFKDSHAELRKEITKLKLQGGSAWGIDEEEDANNEREANLALHTGSGPTAKDKEFTENEPYGLDLIAIQQQFSQGQYEEATIKWLQSPYQAELFAEFFSAIDPSYLQDCSPLVTLSVAAGVTSKLEAFTDHKLAWLETILSNLDNKDPDIEGVVPKIMGVIIQRLEALYRHLTEETPHTPTIPELMRLTRMAADIGGKLR